MNIHFYLSGNELLCELPSEDQKQLLKHLRYNPFVGPQSLEQLIFNHLKNNGQTLATAESATGGLIAHKLTNISGSSEIFKSSLVCYQNEQKVTLLNFEPDFFKKNDVYSLETTTAMATQAQKITKADWTIALSGIAGAPVAKHPTGECFISIAHPLASKVSHYHFRLQAKTRLECKEKFATLALLACWNELNS